MTSAIDLAAALDHLDDGLAILDGMARVRYANAPLRRALAGGPAGPLIGRALWDVAPGTDRHALDLLLGPSGRPSPASCPIGHVERGGRRLAMWARRLPDGVLVTVREPSDRPPPDAPASPIRDRVELAMAASLDGMWWWDLATGALWMSAQLAATLGERPESSDARYDQFVERIHPEDRPRLEAALADHAARGRPYRAEYRIRRRDGAWRWHLTRGASVRDASGAVVRMAGTTSDVTDWREAEEALRESEARFRILAASAPLGIFLANAAGRVVYANPRVLEMFTAGYEQMLDGTFLTRIHPDDRTGVEAAWSAAVRAASESVQRYRLVRGDGGVRWVEGRTAPIRGEDRQVVGHIGIVNDVTEQREAELALEASENRFRTLAEEAPIGIYQIDADGTLLYVNRAAHRILGMTPGRDVSAFFSRVHPDDRPALEERRQRLLDPATLREMEFRVANPDRSVRWVRIRAAAISGPDGRIAGRIGTLEDVTASRAADAARRELESRIQHAQKLESLGVLAGGIAHDFNNLLVGILGNASLAMLDLPAESPAREPVQQIQAAAERSADLTRQLLAYAGKGQFEIRRVHLTRLVTDVLPLLQAALSKRVELRHDFAPALPEIDGDPAQLTQVVMNLLTNASDAIGDRTGVVSIRTEVRALDRSALTPLSLGADLAPGDYVGLEVADTGAGMDQATLDRIFEPFFTTKFTGRGLGLAAVLGIVRSHRGALSVESTPGGGTTFRVWLPVRAGGADAVVLARREVAAARATGLVLVADDEPSVRLVTRKFLERWGFEVIEAADGLEALATAEREADRLRLVLLDITMPRKDGIEAFRELRQVNRRLPVVLMSGFSEQAAATDLGRFGRALFIQKPFKGDDLRRVISEAIRESGD